MMENKDGKLLSFYKNVSIFSFVLMQPAMIVNETIVNLGLSLSQGRVLLFLNLFALSMFSVFRTKLSNIQKTVLFTFLFSTLYFLFLARMFPLSEGLTRPISNFITAIMILILINDDRFQFNRLIEFFVKIAFVLSLLSIVQYIGHYLGIITFKGYTYLTYSPGWRTGINFGGFAEDYSTFGILRNQSFFIEPARFAQFLMIPIFISLHKLIINKDKSKLFVLVSISLAFLLTFSVANYFGLLIGLTIYFIFLKKRTNFHANIGLRITSLVIIVLIVLIGINLFEISNKYTYGSGIIIGKNTVNSVLERLDRFEIAKSAISESFFGNPDLRIVFNRNPSALGLVIIYGGIPFLILCLVYAGSVYSMLFKRIIASSSYGLIYAGCIAYFIPFNWYGMYTENLFLFQLVFALTIVKYELRNTS